MGRARAAIQVKARDARILMDLGRASSCLARSLHDLHALWLRRERQDQYVGTLVNAYLEAGGAAVWRARRKSYVDVGTLNGYREAIRLLERRKRRRSFRVSRRAGLAGVIVRCDGSAAQACA